MVGDGFLLRERNVAANLFPSSIAHFEYMFLQSQIHHTDVLFSLVRVTGYVSIGTKSRIAPVEIPYMARGHASGSAVAGLHSFPAFFAIEGCIRERGEDRSSPLSLTNRLVPEVQR
jgi:hypothetical protein